MPRFSTTSFISILSLTPLLDARTAFAAPSNNLDANVSNVLVPTPVFSGSYVATPTQAKLGRAILLGATITDVSGNLLNGNVTLEIHDSSNQKIWQKYFTGQSFTAGQEQTWRRVWIPTSPGTYTYQVGVMDSTWSIAYLWNTAATLTISSNVTDTRPRDGYGWVPCTSGGVFTPLSDAAAAALVHNVQADSATRAAANATPNNYVPTASDLAPLTSETNDQGQTCVQANPYCAYVTGNFAAGGYLSNPNTDQLIQWAAIKWGMPPDWYRAEYVHESDWYQWLPGSASSPLICTNCDGNSCGDLTTVGSPSNYPALSRISSTQVCQSLGIAQVRWDHPDGNEDQIGSEPGRWKSTAFNIDFALARIRFYFDNPNGLRAAWGDSSYVACQNWNSLGAWFLPYPWGNSGQTGYVTTIQGILSNRTWAQPGF